MGSCASNNTNQEKDDIDVVNDIAIHGYIREMENESNLFIPNDIYQLITIFCDTSWKFDTLTEPWDSYMDDWITNNGRMFTFGKSVRKYITASCSKGYSFGIHEFNIRYSYQTQSSWQRHIYDYNASFGIVAGNAFISNEHIHQHKDVAYYIGAAGNIYCNQNGKSTWPDYAINSLTRWNSDGCIIAMTLNCIDWTLTFQIDENAPCVINIAPNRTYYVCICTQKVVSTFSIV